MEYDDTQAWEDVTTHFPNMTIYYVYLLRKGPTWSAEETPEVNALQEAHLANMRRLGDMGKLVLNGPLLDSMATSGEIRGIGVLKTGSLREAQDLIGTDPMVKEKTRASLREALAIYEANESPYIDWVRRQLDELEEAEP